jgi:site-specific DNA-methyltransferase (adenine-specific)
LEINKIYNEDCLQGMKRIQDASIDMILCDLPYGVTDCKWDSVIPFDLLWEQYERIIKKNGAVILFGIEPFSTKLRLSNLSLYKYDWIWLKSKVTGFVHAKNSPMRKHENISVFSKAPIGHKSTLKEKRMIYNPQNLLEKKEHNKTLKKFGGTIGKRPSHKKNYISEYTNYPTSVLEFASDSKLHPTQKPVALCEYLIKTYTNENDIVLDNCIGSGTTAIACINTNRNFIGFEIEKKYADIANKRIEQAHREKEAEQ